MVPLPARLFREPGMERPAAAVWKETVLSVAPYGARVHRWGKEYVHMKSRSQAQHARVHGCTDENALSLRDRLTRAGSARPVAAVAATVEERNRCAPQAAPVAVDEASGCPEPASLLTICGPRASGDRASPSGAAHSDTQAQAVRDRAGRHLLLPDDGSVCSSWPPAGKLPALIGRSGTRGGPSGDCRAAAAGDLGHCPAELPCNF